MGRQDGTRRRGRTIERSTMLGRAATLEDVGAGALID
jgi:hypothetical protein